MIDRFIYNGNVSFVSCSPAAFKRANKSFNFAINLAYSLNTYLNIVVFLLLAVCLRLITEWRSQFAHIFIYNTTSLLTPERSYHPHRVSKFSEWR